MAGRKIMQKPQPSSQLVQADARPIKYMLGDLPKISSDEVSALKEAYVTELRKTARINISAERVGLSPYIVGKWLDDDPSFRERVDAAQAIRIDEIEMDLEGSQNRSGGDVTARLFMLKGLRPDKFQDRIVQQTYTHSTYEPQFTLEVVGNEKKAEETKAH